MKGKLIATIILVLGVFLACRVLDLAIFPVVSMEYGVEQVEDNVQTFQEIQTFEYMKTIYRYVLMSVTGLLVLTIWWKPIKKVFGGK